MTVVYTGVARRLQLRGQLWNWPKAAPHSLLSDRRTARTKVSLLLHLVAAFVKRYLDYFLPVECGNGLERGKPVQRLKALFAAVP